MPRPFRLVQAAAASAAACAVAADAAPVSGVVVGNGVVRHARVCLDLDGDARCGPREPATWSDERGHYTLPRAGAVVAEVGTDAAWIDPVTGASRPVARPFVLRAGTWAAGVVGPLSTEILAVAEGSRLRFEAARHIVAARLGVDDGLVLADPWSSEAAPARERLQAEAKGVVDRSERAVAVSGARGDRRSALAARLDLEGIDTFVVIYDENRSFDNVFGGFPGAQTLRATAKRGEPVAQKDRDGSVLKMLPPAWGGLTAAGQKVTVTQAQTTNVWPNAPFRVDAPRPAWGSPAIDREVITRDLYHRFFENQMQIAGGRNDGFVAWGDAGGLVMGSFEGPATALWKIAREYTLADHFFQGAFGGSFLNHQYLVCACAPEYPDADTAPAHPTIAALDAAPGGGWLPRLTVAANSPASALDGPPVFALSGNITPRNYFGDATFRAINTMQPAYQPSGNPPAGDDKAGRYADPAKATTLPAQTVSTIGDLLGARGIGWRWYAGGWNAALADRTTVYNAAAANFQAHHQPFNYMAVFDPATHADARAEHLKDGADLLADAAAGRLPPVAFYKPVGVDNEHPGYASLARGDAHVAAVVKALQASPQWPHMLVIVTYDEFGGQWDELPPPEGDLLGPGTRIPAVIVSPLGLRHHVDATPYDTGSILRFITHRWSLPALPGLAGRDAAREARGQAALGDLTDALELKVRGR